MFVCLLPISTFVGFCVEVIAVKEFAAEARGQELPHCALAAACDACYDICRQRWVPLCACVDAAHRCMRCSPAGHRPQTAEHLLASQRLGTCIKVG